MNKNYFSYKKIFIMLAILATSNSNAVSITTHDCIVRIYEKNPKLPLIHTKYIKLILKPFENDSGVITLNQKTRRMLWWKTKMLTSILPSRNIKHQAALLVHKLVQELRKNDHIKDQSTTTQKQESCVICLEPMNEESLTLACGHQFCQACILQWMRSSIFSNCPLCRKSINS